LCTDQSKHPDLGVRNAVVAANLVEAEDLVELLPVDALRDGDLTLVVVACDDLQRVVPELIVAERPAEATTRYQGGGSGARPNCARERE
jgi:hypothetical protein